MLNGFHEEKKILGTQQKEHKTNGHGLPKAKIGADQKWTRHWIIGKGVKILKSVWCGGLITLKTFMKKK